MNLKGVGKTDSSKNVPIKTEARKSGTNKDISELAPRDKHLKFASRKVKTETFYDSTKRYIEVYNEEDAQRVIGKLRLYSEQENAEKMKHYLEIVKNSRLVYDIAMATCGVNWLRDKFYKYLFVCYELPDWLNDSEIPEQLSVVKIPDARESYIADIDPTARPAERTLKRISAREYIKLAQIKCPIETSTSFKDPYEDDDCEIYNIDQVRKKPSQDFIKDIEEKLTRIDVEKIQPFRFIDILRQKKDLSYGDKLFIREYDRRQKEAEKERLLKENDRLIMECTIRKYKYDANGVNARELDPRVAEEKQNFDNFTNNVKTYIYDGGFPITRIIEYMTDFCDLSEMLTFENNNPNLEKDLQLLWKRRCKLDYDMEMPTKGNCWKATYINHWRFLHSTNEN
ncbi:hypothetical protein ACOME3_004491 [Neoechinorhynchus agilis]